MGFWDDRYRSETYAYGVEPNDFLRASAARIPPGRVLCLAEGEGRNAVFLASLGYAVTAVDLSSEGLRKAERLARERGVTIDVVQADLGEYEPEAGAYAGVVSIFAHLPRAARGSIWSSRRTWSATSTRGRFTRDAAPPSRSSASSCPEGRPSASPPPRLSQRERRDTQGTRAARSEQSDVARPPPCGVHAPLACGMSAPVRLSPAFDRTAPRTTT